MNHPNPNISCPKCGAEIPLTDAISHRIREELAQEFETKRKEQDLALAVRERKLVTAQADVERKQLGVGEEVARQVAAEKARLQAEALRQAQAAVAVDLQDMRAQLSVQATQLRAALQAELELRRQKRELAEQKANLELEVARTLDAERGKIRESAKTAVIEEERLKLAEKETLIGDLQKQITTLKLRAEQGSMQTQGEVLEQALQDDLTRTFPMDDIVEVAKGVKGGDVMHRVRAGAGLDCGTILWEAKRTKNWGKDWTAKLKQDQREAKADVAVIVTQVLPEGVQNFGQLDGVWVCSFACALPLALAVRQGLVSAAAARQAESGRQGKTEQLYSYVSGIEFRQRVEGLVETFVKLQNGVQEERRVFEKRWAAREKEIAAAIQHTALIYGGIQGIVGQNTLPEIKTLQLEAGEIQPTELGNRTNL